jgi:phosphoribosylanthranilate isomerase
VAVEVKVCGLRRGGDAAVAIERGAAYLGVVYAGGPRKVSDTEAAEVVAAAAGRPVLAVWGTPDREAILRSRDIAKFSGVQLHGGGDLSFAAALRQEGLIVWRVARLGGPDDLAALPALMNEADAVLVEPKVPGKDGGAGVPLSLDLAQQARRAFDGHLTTHDPRPTTRFALAGGLTPDTVAQAIRTVRPDIVDVSSGVESSPGRKDPLLIQKFLDHALADLPLP